MRSGTDREAAGFSLRTAVAAFAAAATFAVLFGDAATAHESHRHRTQAAERAPIVAADDAQSRHEFDVARGRLDRLLADDPRDLEARLMRANLSLLAGRHVDARRDCLAVLDAGALYEGTVCYASALTGAGSVERSRRLVAALGEAGQASDEVQSWRLLTEADLALRADDPGSARVLLERAHALDPRHEEARTQLAEFLLAQDEPARALAVSLAPDPSVARQLVRLRAALVLEDPRAGAWRQDLEAMLEDDRRRGIPPHLREEGQLALFVDGNAAAALALAQRNFETQRDTRDLRLLAAAAAASGDPPALAAVRGWLRATGFQDRVTERMLFKHL